MLCHLSCAQAEAFQAKRAVMGAWRRDMLALTGVTRLLDMAIAPAAALVFICHPDTHTLSTLLRGVFSIRYHQLACC